MIKENLKFLNRFIVFIDGLCIISALLLAWVIRFRTGWIPSGGKYLALSSYLKPLIVIVPIYLSLYNTFGLYRPYRIKSMFDEFYSILKSNFIGLLLFTLILYLVKEMNYSRYLLFIFSCCSIVITAFERLIVRSLLRHIRRKGKNKRHIILIGYSDLALEFLSKIAQNKHWGYNVLGIVSDKTMSVDEINSNIKSICSSGEDEVAASVDDSYYNNFFQSIKMLGDYSDLDKILSKHNVDEIFITLGLKDYDKLGKIIYICEKNGVRTQIIPDYFRYIPARPYVEEVAGLPIINIRYIPLDSLVNKFIKRAFDIIVAILCIVIFSPVMLVTALIIKVTSPGPIIFKQERIGLNRKKFIMYKLRSMHIQDPNNEKKEWTNKEDPRKTKFGSLIRKTSIDELPQFFNVLKGDMSIIGPRPERPFFVDKFKEEIPKYMVKHQVRPGITGWAQVNGYRGDTSITKRIEHDIYYIENWRIGFDIKIMWLTLFKGFVNKNAY